MKSFASVSFDYAPVSLHMLADFQFNNVEGKTFNSQDSHMLDRNTVCIFSFFLKFSLK